jgi:hypothetical protein
MAHRTTGDFVGRFNVILLAQLQAKRPLIGWLLIVDIENLRD